MAVATIYALYYVAIAVALWDKLSWVLIALSGAHLLIGALTACSDKEGFEAASKSRYDFLATPAKASAAAAADVLLAVSLVTAIAHVVHPEHAALFYTAWGAALVGNTACFVSHLPHYWQTAIPHSRDRPGISAHDELLTPAELFL